MVVDDLQIIAPVAHRPFKLTFHVDLSRWSENPCTDLADLRYQVPLGSDGRKEEIPKPKRSLAKLTESHSPPTLYAAHPHFHPAREVIAMKALTIAILSLLLLVSAATFQSGRALTAPQAKQIYLT